MTEQEFIFNKLFHLQNQINHLTDIVDKQSDTIGNLLHVIEEMQSPEYASRLAKTAQMVDVAEKLEFIRNLNKKKS